MEETKQIAQIIVEFFPKAVQIILESRIPALSRAVSSASSSPSSSPTIGRGDKWFNLNLSLADNAKLPGTEPWSKIPTLEPMCVDILLSDVASTSRPAGQGFRGGCMLLERWMVQYAMNSPVSTLRADVERPVVYKKAIILLRSLYSTARLLPAYRIYRDLQKNRQSFNAIRLIYRISVSPESLPRRSMKAYNFTPVETQYGKLCLSVSYLANLVCRPANEIYRPESPITQIIPDYCASPSSERRLQGVSRGKHGISSAPNSPGYRTGGLGRCHSWSGDINKILHPSLPQQSPLHRFNTSPNPNYHTPSVNSHTPPLPMPPRRCYSNLDRFQSTSPSPPMRSRLSNENLFRDLLRTESLPLITSPISGVRSPQNVAGDYCVQIRNLLPHHTNRSRKPHAISRAESANSRLISVHSPSALGSPPTSGNFVVPRPSEVRTNMQTQAGDMDEKDGIGLPQVMVSRSSSRHSYNYEIEDDDLSCPFALDGDESDSYKSRAESLDGKGNMPEVMEASGQIVSTPRRSQNAALGELVEMLKSAPPLQQNFEFPLGFSQGTAEIWRSDSSRGFSIGKEHDAASISTAYSTSRMVSTAADALRDLKNYVEIKDCLLRQSGVPEGRRA